MFDDACLTKVGANDAGLQTHQEVTKHFFRDEVEAQLLSVLRDHVAKQHEKGGGRLAAELVHRRLVAPRVHHNGHGGRTRCSLIRVYGGRDTSFTIAALSSSRP